MADSKKTKADKAIQKILQSDDFIKLNYHADEAFQRLTALIEKLKTCVETVGEITDDMNVEEFPNNQAHYDCLDGKRTLLEEAIDLLEDTDLASLTEAINKIYEAFELTRE